MRLICKVTGRAASAEMGLEGPGYNAGDSEVTAMMAMRAMRAMTGGDLATAWNVGYEAVKDGRKRGDGRNEGLLA